MSDSNDSQNDRTSPLGCVTKLSDYILKSREERTAHIDLTTECEPCGSGARKKHILLDFLQLTNDVENWTTARIHRCHLCEHGRRNGWCINPRHFYFGTASENQMDLPLGFRQSRGYAKVGGYVCEKTREKFERFKLEYSTDVSLHTLSLRELGRRFDTDHQAIKRWISLL